MKNNIFVGMNLHRSGSSYYAYPKENLSSNMDLCVELGCKYIRYNNSCSDDDGIADALRSSKIAHEKGLGFMLVIDNSNWFSDDIADIEPYFESYFEKISTELKGEVDIYQLFNEMDVTCMRGDIANIILPGKDGIEKGEYDSVRFDKAIKAVKGAIKGIKKGYKDAKICFNFAWWHTALLYALCEQNCKFDYIGLDWYSDCEEVSSIDKLIADLEKHISDSKFIICETNYWMHPMGRDPLEKQNALKVEASRFSGQEKWVPEFIEKVINMNNDRLSGIIFYELLDEPVFEENKGDYHGESHFGFVKCDKYGNNQIKKPAYFSLMNAIKRLEYEN